jgi:hypothetical protein
MADTLPYGISCQVSESLDRPGSRRGYKRNGVGDSRALFGRDREYRDG